MRQIVKPRRVSAWKIKDSKPLTVKFCGYCKAGEIPSPTGESVGEAHGVLEHTQTHCLAACQARQVHLRLRQMEEKLQSLRDA